MHIADGILRPEVCALTGILSIGAIGYSLHKLKDSLADRTVPLTGMMSALIFAGQMLNFPIGLPVSGHLIGGVLAGVVLGPWAGCLSLSMVLLVQCLLFSDGGILALGSNILHMGVVGAMGGYAVYAAGRRLLGNGTGGIVVAAVIASWISVMAAAALFCVEFWFSVALEYRLSASSAVYGKNFDFTNIFTLMVSLHSLIGIGEAMITGSVVRFVLQQRPDLIYRPVSSCGAGARVARGIGRFVTAGIVCSLGLAAFLAPFASPHPDGLEAVAERLGFDRLETPPQITVFEQYQAPLPVGGRNNATAWQKLSVSVAGLLGTSAVCIIALSFGYALRSRLSRAESKHAE